MHTHTQSWYTLSESVLQCTFFFPKNPTQISLSWMNIRARPYATTSDPRAWNRRCLTAVRVHLTTDTTLTGPANFQLLWVHLGTLPARLPVSIDAGFSARWKSIGVSATQCCYFCPGLFRLAYRISLCFFLLRVVPLW